MWGLSQVRAESSSAEFKDFIVVALKGNIRPSTTFDYTSCPIEVVAPPVYTPICRRSVGQVADIRNLVT